MERHTIGKIEVLAGIAIILFAAFFGFYLRSTLINQFAAGTRGITNAALNSTGVSRFDVVSSFTIFSYEAGAGTYIATLLSIITGLIGLKFVFDGLLVIKEDLYTRSRK
jgi:hypothetical protein